MTGLKIDANYVDLNLSNDRRTPQRMHPESATNCALVYIGVDKLIRGSFPLNLFWLVCLAPRLAVISDGVLRGPRR